MYVCVLGGAVRGASTSDSQFQLSPYGVKRRCAHTHTVCKTPPPTHTHTNSTACQRSPHTSAHSRFFILYNYSSNTPKGKVTHVRTHISSSTWLNVTVGHVLICWRYRVNDGHVVTFTQARESMQPLPGAEGDGKA